MDKYQHWLYVLRLEGENYYVGLTRQKDPKTRIKQHLDGFYSAQWVKKHKPIEAIEIIDLGRITQDEARKQENYRTRQYMKKYGLQSTRGGDLNYSGKYVKIGNRLTTEDNWYILKSSVILMAVMILLAYLQLFHQ